MANRNQRYFLLFVCLIILLVQRDISAVEIVSLGGACDVARAARQNGLRTTAYPFDWLITPYKSLYEAFADDFQHVLLPEEVYVRDDGKAVVDGYGFMYIHDFPSVRYPIAPNDTEIMPVHGIASTWFDALSIVQAKFQRRLARLINFLCEGKLVALVRYNEMGKEEAQEFIDLLKLKYPQAKVVLVVLGDTQEFREPWNIPHVRNMYIDKKYFKNWNGSQWKEVMQVIAAFNPEGWHKPESCQESYVLTLPNYNPGMFSAFNMVLGALDWYDRGLITGLRIDFGNDGWYFDATRGNNWWNYYFAPITVGNSSAVISEKLFPTFKKIKFAYESQFEMSRERAYELISKYINVLPRIQQCVNSFYTEYFEGNCVIGVHYRGTDKLEAEPVSYQEVVERIQHEIAGIQAGVIRLFVATDDERFAQYIKEQFPHMVVMQDALRGDSSTGVHMRMDFAPYQKGEQALIDCLLLSRCDLLIKMASNLSDCSTFFSPNLPVIKLNKSFSE